MLQDPGVATVQVPTVPERDVAVASQSSGLVPGNVATVQVPTVTDVPERDVTVTSQSSGLLFLRRMSLPGPLVLVLEMVPLSKLLVCRPSLENDHMRLQSCR